MMKMTAWKHPDDRLPPREVALRMRAVDLNSNAPRTLVVNDLTHAWDGWLFGLLTLGAVWPVVRALGWF